MAYIGNALTALIYAAKHRDDIVPDGVTSTFELSQQVPGGYESNILVFRRRYIKDVLVANSSLIDIDGTAEKITITDNALAGVFSVVQPPVPGISPGDNLHISGAVNGLNNSVFPVLPNGVIYDGASIEILLDGNLISESGGSITVTRGYVGFWEVLEPEVDYTVSGPPGPQYNKLITLTEVPQIDDVVYVIHQGDATYNFVPTQASVGPDQLQPNLRNFTCDRYTGDGATTTFALTQEAVSSKSLLVTVDGIESDGDDPDQLFVGEWELDTGGNSITFHSAPANTAKIRILHLGFSTVSRRAALSPGQAGTIAPGSVTATQLANSSVTTPKLDDGSVTKPKIAADAVDSTKLLLLNTQSVRGVGADAAIRSLLQINASNETVIHSEGSLPLSINGQGVQIRLADGILRPEVHNDIELGNASFRWKSIHVQGAARLGATEVDSLLSNGTTTSVGHISTTNGNISTTNGNVSGVNGNFSNVNVTTINNAPLTELGAPPGSIVMTGRSTAPTGWLLCDGAIVSQATYPSLFAAIGTNFNVGGEPGGTFRLPDLRQRFPLGKAASGTGSVLGQTGGAIDHTHIGPSHTHDMSNHFHNIPAHFHSMGPTSTLAITTASGSHTTSISHSHSAANTSEGTPHSHSPGTLNITLSGGGGSTGNQSHDHSHGFDVFTDFSGSHSHTIHGMGVAGAPLSEAQWNTALNNGAIGNSPHRFTKAESVDGGSFTGLTNGSTNGGSPDGTHSHRVLGNTGGASQGHTHITPHHTHSSSDFAGSTASESSHTHSFTTPAFNGNSTSDGSHTHAASSFSGSIGNVGSGNSGDSIFLSGTPSNNNTGASGASATSSNNPPYLVVNYIIKI